MGAFTLSERKWFRSVVQIGWFRQAQQNYTNTKVEFRYLVASVKFPFPQLVQVFLPKEALQEAHRQLEGNSVRVKFVVYYSDKLFQPKVEQDVKKTPAPEKTSNDVEITSSDEKEKAPEKKEPEFSKLGMSIFLRKLESLVSTS